MPQIVYQPSMTCPKCGALILAAEAWPYCTNCGNALAGPGESFEEEYADYESRLSKLEKEREDIAARLEVMDEHLKRMLAKEQR